MIKEINVEKNSKLLNILNNGKLNVIFGAGSVATIFMESVKKLEIPIYSFLVNDNHKKDNIYMGIPVYELKNFNLSEDECNIFIAIRSKDKEIIKPLQEMYCKNIVYIDYTKDIVDLKKIYYVSYFNKKNIDIMKKIININGYKMINPFFKQNDYLLAWLCEIGDIILPEAFLDFSQIDDGPYEYENVTLKKDDVVIDCGANIGLFSSVAATKGCEVYAFEPFLKTQEYLKEIVQIYYDKIHICPYAVSNKNGISKFTILDNDIGGNSMFDIKLNENDYYINVETITIDSFVKNNSIQKVDYIKADIEGSERFMLMGAMETLARFAPKLSLCTYHLDDDPEVLESLIKEANPNYVIQHKWKKIYAYVPEGKR